MRLTVARLNSIVSAYQAINILRSGDSPTINEQIYTDEMLKSLSEAAEWAKEELVRRTKLKTKGHDAEVAPVLTSTELPATPVSAV